MLTVLQSLELTSTGGQFQPFQEDADPKTRQLRIWVPEVRRVVTFVYKTTVTVKVCTACFASHTIYRSQGILAHRYVLKDSEILNQTSNPDKYGTEGRSCMGLTNILAVLNTT